MIQINNLSIGYDKKVVIAGINAHIAAGEMTCLLGANGVGKSTLLRTISAFQPKLAGTIHIDGKPLESYSVSQLAHKLSVVLTERCNIRNMSVDDLIGIGRSPYTGFWGVLSREDKRIVNECAELVGISPLMGRMIHTLSDGERQKVMIAKALAQETPIIFLDEPTAFLDFPSKVEIMILLKRLSREMGKTIFISSHDIELALQLADTLWLMNNDGITVGAPKDLASDGVISKFFSEGRDCVVAENIDRMLKNM